MLYMLISSNMGMIVAGCGGSGSGTVWPRRVPPADSGDKRGGVGGWRQLTHCGPGTALGGWQARVHPRGDHSIHRLPRGRVRGIPLSHATLIHTPCPLSLHA